MCEECGCGKKAMNQPGVPEARITSGSKEEIIIDRSVTEANDAIAHDIFHALQKKGLFCINIMGSPGSGKTTVIEGIAPYLGKNQVAVIQGDLESDVDKKRLEKAGIQAFQINTHSGCHLNALMVKDALLNMNLEGKRYLIIENVGNLVCPALIRIGQHMNMVVSSTAEGSDKPRKYPVIFMDAGLIVISKSDIAQHVGFSEKDYVIDLKMINSKAQILMTSSRNPESFSAVAAFMMQAREHFMSSWEHHGHTHTHAHTHAHTQHEDRHHHNHEHYHGDMDHHDSPGGNGHSTHNHGFSHGHDENSHENHDGNGHESNHGNVQNHHHHDDYHNHDSG